MISEEMIQYTEKDYQRIRELSIETLKKFIEICEKYNLKYFAISGTAIGAVRHGGFIPWDDDMDVGMLREDYDRFLEVAPKELDGVYELYSASTQKQVQGFYTQMFKKGSLFITQHNTRWALHPGIKLDIFPYDNVPASGQERRKLYSKLRFWNRLYIIRNTKIPYFKGNSIGIKLLRLLCGMSYYVMRLCGPSVNRIVERYEQLSRMYTGQTGYYTIMDDMNPDWWVIKKNEIYPLQEQMFEGISIKLPASNHEMLLRQYGDYMQLPPETERHGHDVVKLTFPKE